VACFLLSNENGCASWLHVSSVMNNPAFEKIVPSKTGAWNVLRLMEAPDIPFMKGALPQVYLGQAILKPPAGKSQNKKYGTGFLWVKSAKSTPSSL